MNYKKTRREKKEVGKRGRCGKGRGEKGPDEDRHVRKKQRRK